MKLRMNRNRVVRASVPSRRKRRARVVAAVAVVVAALASACGSTGDQASSSDVPVVKVGTTTTGSTTLTRLVIDQEKLDAKHGVKIEWVALDNAAVQKAFALKQFDVNFAETPLDLMRARAAGDAAHAVSIGSLANVYISVKSNSPYQNLGDLRGKKLGLYSLSSGSTAALARIVSDNFGLNLYKDFQLVVAPPPALVGLMQRGEIEGMVNIDPTSLQMLADGGVREIMDVGQQWQQRTGGPLLVSTVAVRDSFAKQNAATTQRLVDVFREAVNYIQTHDDVYETTGFVKLSGLQPTPSVLKLFQQRFGKLYSLQWDAKVIDANNAVVDEAISEGTIKKPDPGWYTFDYVH